MQYPTIILLRHGETEWNLISRYQGHLDSPLTAKGIDQAKANAKKLEKVIGKLDQIKIYSSPLGRAKASCTILCDELNISLEDIIYDDRIKEFSYGIFEGKTKDECQLNYSKDVAAREADKWNYQIPDGESYKMVTRRLKSWLADIEGESIIIMVAHEMVNRALRGLYRGLETEETLQLRQANDLVLMLKNSGEYILN